MPISAPPPSWESIKNKPTTVGGFGISDLDTVIAGLSGFSRSISSSGFQKLTGGLIVQWGKVVNAGAWSSKNVTLPISFPSGGLSILVGETNAGTAHAFAGAFVSNSVFNAFSGSGSAAWDIYWIAIGY